MQLGIFPSWQYSDDPAVNPKINPFVQYPAGVYQTTVQPLGPYYGGLSAPRRPVQLLGLRGFGSIGDTVSSIGTLIVLGLAGFGGWTLFKKFR